MEQINQQLLDLRNEIKELKEKGIQKEILSMDELMKWLNISRATVHRWRKDSILNAYFLGKKIFFKRSEVLKSLESEN